MIASCSRQRELWFASYLPDKMCQLDNLILRHTMVTADNPKRPLLVHFLGALAYRTQKALRGAPPEFAAFAPGNRVRTPQELVRHMTSVLGYSRTFFLGGTYTAVPLDTLDAEIQRFHEMVEEIARLLTSGAPLSVTEEQLLQGPLADAMTHAGQLALLRRLAGVPVPPENFVVAEIASGRLGADQSAPVSPDAEWPERLP